MMKLPLRLSFGCLLMMSFSATAKSYDFIQEHLEQAFSSSVVLSDSDVFTAGFNNFDPNDWFKTDNDNLGTPESIENRKKYKSSTLPITLALSEEEAYHQHQLFFRLSASVIDDELRITNIPGETERYRQSVLGGAMFYRYQYRLTDHWTLTPAIGTHLLYYRNTVTYNNPQFKMLFSPLDGLLVNTYAWANLVETNLKIQYEEEKSWGRWKASSAWHYFGGYGWGKANNGEVGNPEGWYIANTLTGVYDFTQLGRSVQSIYGSIKRVDVGSTPQEPLGTSNYYEASFGWLMTPPFEMELVDNIGLGLTFNYGSAFKGGSIVLFFNQD
ncbi:Solitary outer membrane autotransporter beta-barrel domain [Vibrio cholerae]|nr:Solitary outer membrane autotransporter beta-barrel domain [Vibrio cholerae]KAA1009952.1 Solitary outer membrane autotransporter beta-barrel domain [Vibrio cholerae]KAA1018523.1 Solitary outer membrane autotransporter beta-barrel domain [Vibrio cholerae]KAA1022582.1 Solitary outer membrane autotransporter beta-barrel domain [Vibrio cholerae]KAA1025381.1 Solitary outer membrane autotransporter beta-barrel domain [Vibrio cholerae]